MRRDLAKRIGELERVAGPVKDARSIPITPELRAAVCADPDDAAAFARVEAGDKSGYADMSTPALVLLQEAGGKVCTMAGCDCR